MKNIQLCAALVMVLGFAACGKKKEQIVVEETTVKKHQVKRVSGPLSDKDAGFTQEDYK